MGRNASSCSGSILAILAAVLVISFSDFDLVTAVAKDPIKFTYYLHDDFVPPGITAVQTISTSGNFSEGLSHFGDMSVFDSPLKAGISNTSMPYGFHSGIVTRLSQPLMVFITVTAELNTPQYSGFYTLQGRFNSSAPSWNLTITGGTGSFLGAGGYASVSVPVPDFVNGPVIQYDVNMFF